MRGSMPVYVALVAMERFAELHLPAHEGLVMASYTAAQGLLAS